MKVVGYRKSAFTGNDVSEVVGYNLYCLEPLEKGEGMAAERFFLTSEKLRNCGYEPNLGDEVQMSYNRYGKVAQIVKVG